MTLQQYIAQNREALKSWAVAAFGYVPIQSTIDSINLHSWVATFPALRKEAEEHGVTKFPKPDQELYRYITSLSKRTF